MTTMHTIGGVTYIVTRERLRGVFPYTETRANPVLWFGYDLETRDIVCTGTKTQKECLGILQDDANARR